MAKQPPSEEMAKFLEQYPILLPASLMMEEETHDEKEQSAASTRISSSSRSQSEGGEKNPITTNNNCNNASEKDSQQVVASSAFAMQQPIHHLLDVNNPSSGACLGDPPPAAASGQLSMAQELRFNLFQSSSLPGLHQHNNSPLWSSAESSSVDSMDLDTSDQKEAAPMIRPFDADVVCVKGKKYAQHPGNHRFNRIIQEALPKYMKAPTKVDKSIIIDQIIDTILEFGSGNVRFVRYNRKLETWMKLKDNQIRDKVGHALRDAVEMVHRQAEI